MSPEEVAGFNARLFAAQAEFEADEAADPANAAPDTTAGKSSGEVIDLLATLQKSVTAAKSARAEKVAPDPTPEPDDGKEAGAAERHGRPDGCRPGDGCPCYPEPDAGDVSDHASPDTTGLREVCGECGHQHTERGCVGEPTPSDLWAGVSVGGCDCDFDTTPTAASLAADLRATGDADAARRLADGLRGSS